MKNNHALLLAALFVLIFLSAFSEETKILKTNLHEPAVNVYEILGGEWNFVAWGDKNVLPDYPERVSDWGKCNVPGLWYQATNIPAGVIKKYGADWYDKVDSAWYMTVFTIPPEFKGWNSEICFEGIKWDAEIYLNGIRLGKNIGGFAPISLNAGDVPKFGKQNMLLIKANGFNSVTKDENKNPDISAGFVLAGEKKCGGITGKVYMHFFKGARITRLQIKPVLSENGIKAAFSLDIPQTFSNNLYTEFTLLDAENGETLETYNLPPVSYERKKRTDLLYFLPIKKYDLWSPENPKMYRLKARIYSDDAAKSIQDAAESAFGMREIEIKDNKALLNGKSVKLFGMNLGSENGYYMGYDLIRNTDKTAFYLLKLTRFMNANCIKTDLEPINPRWLDFCDRNGIFVISEFPAGIHVAGDVNKKLVENKLREISALLPSLWNHPSLIAYSLKPDDAADSTSLAQNEKIEQKLLVPFVKIQDPTRPVILQGKLSGDFCDIESVKNVRSANIHDYEGNIDKILTENQGMNFSICSFLGIHDEGEYKLFDEYSGKLITPDESSVLGDEISLAAQIAYNRASFLRLKDFALISTGKLSDCIKLASWCDKEHPDTELKNMVTPLCHVLRNCYYPANVVIDLDKENFAINEDTKIPLILINDSATTFSIMGQMFFSNKTGGYSGEHVQFMGRVSTPTVFNKEVQPFSKAKLSCALQMPDVEGDYSIIALMRAQNGDIVYSKKTIRIISSDLNLTDGTEKK